MFFRFNDMSSISKAYSVAPTSCISGFQLTTASHGAPFGAARKKMPYLSAIKAELG